MPTVYQHPGVYVNEVPGGSKPIEGVGTSTAAFIGFAPAGPANKPTRVTSWLDFSRVFGDPDAKTGPYLKNAYLAHAVNGFFSNGGGACYIVRLGVDDYGGVPQLALPAAAAADAPAADLFKFVRRALARDGDGAVVLGRDGLPTELLRPDPTNDKESPSKITITLTADEAPAAGDSGDAAAPPTPTFTVKVSDEKQVAVKGDDGKPTTTAYEQEYKGLTAVAGPRYAAQVINADPLRLIDVMDLGATLPVGQRVLDVAKVGKELVAPPEPDLDAVPTEGPEDLKGDPVHGTGIEGLNGIDEITMVCVPDLMAIHPTDDQIRDVHGKIDAFCSSGQIKRMGILDPPAGLNKQDIFDWREDARTPASNFAVLYWPWVEVMDPFSGKGTMVPPCGHMAGVWAGTDSARGVHKAPANVAVKAVIGVDAEITDGDQDLLNPVGINCIRSFPGSGIRVWGARTLASDPEWRYINVRRLFNYVSASILKGTQWAVFEPNDAFLWSQLRVSVGNFLTDTWRGGALFGATPDEAFFVKCDAETNPQSLIDSGQVNIQIGIAPVKPAEFVIFQIAQYTAQA
jgi:phage tail sheath protein FI